MKIKDEDKTEFVSLLNNLIWEAIYHGGDPGGAYFCNLEDFEKALIGFVNYCSLDETMKINITEHYPTPWIVDKN